MEAERVVIIGLGRIASRLEDDSKREKPASHAGAFWALEGVVLAGGWDIDEESRAQFAERWKVPTEFAGAQDLIDRTRPSIVVVATYPDSHADYVRLAVKAQVPVVVCEKPLTADLAEAKRLVRLIEKFPTRVMVNHERRYARDYRRVQNIIKAQTYGTLQTIRGQLFMGRGRTPAEVLLWDGTHLLDVLRFLTDGELSGFQVWGSMESPGGRITARFLSGEVETWIEVAANRDHLVFELDLSFERGRIRVGNGLYEEQVGAVSPHYDKMRSLVPVDVSRDELYPTGYFSGMAADAVESARDPSHRPASTAHDGWAALMAIDQVLRAGGSSLRRLARIV